MRLEGSEMAAGYGERSVDKETGKVLSMRKEIICTVMGVVVGFGLAAPLATQAEVKREPYSWNIPRQFCHSKTEANCFVDAGQNVSRWGWYSYWVGRDGTHHYLDPAVRDINPGR